MNPSADASSSPANDKTPRRLAVVWGVLSVVLVPLAWGGGPLKTTAVAAAWALLVGAASGGALFLTRLRDGVTTVTDALQTEPGPKRPRAFAGWMLAGLLVGAAVAVLVAATAWGLASALPSAAATVAYVVGGVLAPLAVGRLSPASTVPARSMSRARHLAETALATALLAGPFGTLILWTRLPIASLPEGALRRHFIGSTLLYGLLLGTATFIKSWTEVAWGLVIIPQAKRRPPHPLLFALVLCAALWAVPGVQALGDQGALAAKLLGGATVAVLFGLVGGARGQEAAFRIGRGRRGRR